MKKTLRNRKKSIRTGKRMGTRLRTARRNRSRTSRRGMNRKKLSRKRLSRKRKVRGGRTFRRNRRQRGGNPVHLGEKIVPVLVWEKLVDFYEQHWTTDPKSSLSPQAQQAAALDELREASVSVEAQKQLLSDWRGNFLQPQQIEAEKEIDDKDCDPRGEPSDYSCESESESWRGRFSAKSDRYYWQNKQDPNRLTFDNPGSVPPERISTFSGPRTGQLYVPQKTPAREKSSGSG